MPSLDVIYEELNKGAVIEQPLVESHPRRSAIRGYCSPSGVVTVNPIPDILDTLIHELLHRRYPEWTERTVKRETTKLIRKLTPEAQRALYDHYLSVRDRTSRTKSVL